MGLHPWDLRRYTFIEFVMKYRGYQEALKEQRQADFDIQRWMAYCAIMPHVGKKIGIDKVVPDLYERKTGKKLDPLTIEQKKQRALDFARTLNKNNGG